jgi:hypothetical protein
MNALTTIQQAPTKAVSLADVEGSVQRMLVWTAPDGIDVPE